MQEIYKTSVRYENTKIMNRRDYLRTCGIAAVGGIGALTGCLGSDSESPPRKSNVIEEVAVEEGALVIDPYGDDEQWITTRRDINLQSSSVDEESSESGTLASVSPVGVAEAAKGRGATGRGSGGYSSAPRTHNGRAWYGAGTAAGTGTTTNDWYDENEQEVKRVPADIATIGVAYVGTNERFQEQAPGPGPLEWDEEYENPGTSGQIESRLPEEEGQGWYRVGSEVKVEESEVESGENVNLGWECIDVRIEQGLGLSITERWKVSPEV